MGVDEVTSVLYVIRLVYFLFDRLRKRNDSIRSYTTLDSEIVLVLKNENETETGQDLLAERKNDATTRPVASSSASKIN